MSLLLLTQQVNIHEKIKHAPDSGYLIGVWIGNILPFALFAGLAYYLYYRAKKREDNR